MTIKLRFMPNFLLFGLAYLPGVAFIVHAPLVALVFDFTEDDGELMPIEEPA